MTLTKFILYLILLASCKARTNSSQLRENEQTYPASAFELLLEQSIGKPLKPDQRIPLNYVHLISELKKKNDLHALQALVPVSRSLQRDSVNFQFPRVLTTFFSSSKTFDPVALKGRIFIGYSELADAAEVISLNPTNGKFDFFVLSDFSNAEGFKIVKAPDKVCQACHPSGLPIFTPREWDDTNANPDYAKAIMVANNGKSHYLDVKIDVSDENSNQGSDNQPDFGDISTFDEMVRHSAALRERSLIWDEICEVANQIECRKELLRLQLLRFRYSIERDAFADPRTVEQFKKTYDSMNKKYFHGGFPLIIGGIANVKVEPQVAAATFAEIEKMRASKQTRSAIRNYFDQTLSTIAGSSPLNGFETFTANPHDPAKLKDNVFARGILDRLFNFEFLEPYQDQSLYDLMKDNIDQIIAAIDTDIAIPFLKSPGLTREKFLLFVYEATKKTPSMEFIRKNSALHVVPESEIETDTVPAGLALMRRFCGDCHSSSANQINKVLLSKKEPWKLIKESSAEILKRLDWKRVPANQMMPSLDAQKAMKMTASDAEQIRNYVRSL